jgi:nicotinate-nucleotide--dimethylbenzimidazole phosphoribosyltransferase
VVAAADHGVAHEGVSAYPQEVTAQMVANFVAGGAAINVLARAAGADLVVVDIGVAGAVAADAPVTGSDGGARLVHARVASGTKDLSIGPAMTREEAVAAIDVGREAVNGLIRDGADLVALGEMGIGNTTSASAIVAALTGLPPATVTGRGTGVDDPGLERKVAVIETALALHELDPEDPLAILAAVGGLEIAGLVGAMLAAGAARIPVVLDGFITGAAGLVAAGLAPNLPDRLIAAHRSVEPGHAIVLDRLGLTPILQLDLRLGEGSGAALAIPIIRAAARISGEMATFDEAGVSGAG